MVQAIYQNLPTNSTLIIREHPLYRGKYGSDFYQFLQQNNIYIDFQKNFNIVMQKSEVIIVNNSTVGIEAIAKGKRVVVLGDAYYDSSGLCLKLQEKEKLSSVLQEALHFKIDRKRINAFLYEFLNHHLVNGFITDKNLKAAQTIANRLSSMYVKKTNP